MPWCERCNGYILIKCDCKNHIIKDLDYDDEVEFWAKGDELQVAEEYAERNFSRHDFRDEWDLEINNIKIFVKVESEPVFRASKVSK